METDGPTDKRTGVTLYALSTILRMAGHKNMKSFTTFILFIPFLVGNKVYVQQMMFLSSTFPQIKSIETVLGTHKRKKKPWFY